MTMGDADRNARMRMLREHVLTWDVHRWSRAFLSAAEGAAPEQTEQT
jgi:trehalose-6-phosphate synthase